MSMRFFMQLAHRGKGRGASSGERASTQLAQAAIECVSRLDDNALAGFIEFVQLCHTKPNTARDLYDAGDYTGETA
jgi:hypothetical protein